MEEWLFPYHKEECHSQSEETYCLNDSCRATVCVGRLVALWLLFRAIGGSSESVKRHQQDRQLLLKRISSLCLFQTHVLSGLLGLWPALTSPPFY